MAQVWRDGMNRWLREHHGVISVAALRGVGCSRRQAYRLAQRGELVLVHPGVFRSAQWPDGPMQRMVAACLANPSVAVAFTSAARLWDMRRLPADGRLHVLVPHGCSPELVGVVVHRCRRIDEVDIVVRGDGIRLTSPPRTLFDCADLLGFDATASVLEQLIDREHGTFRTHADTFARLGHVRRPGTRIMKAVIASRPAWREAMQSDLEHRVLAEITRQGLPQPSVQHCVRLPDDSSIRIDFAWPIERVALEVDHPFWHAGATELHRDKHRDRTLQALGWRVPRITDLDVRRALPSAIADVAAILASTPLAA